MGDSWGYHGHYAYNFTHNKQIPHPPPTNQHAKLVVEFEFGTGEARRVIRANEGFLSKFPYFLSRMAAIRYGHDNAPIKLKFHEIGADGGSEALQWMHNKPIAECLKCTAAQLPTRIAEMWDAAVVWELDNLKKDLLKAIRDFIDDGTTPNPGNFINVMTRIYANSTKDDQSDISDTIHTAVKNISVKKWWDSIRRDTTNSFYHRLAGIVFRDLTPLFCNECSIGQMFVVGRCVCCGCAWNPR